jgi:hypothetical protein
MHTQPPHPTQFACNLWPDGVSEAMRGMLLDHLTAIGFPFKEAAIIHKCFSIGDGYRLFFTTEESCDLWVEWLTSLGFQTRKELPRA